MMLSKIILADFVQKIEKLNFTTAACQQVMAKNKYLNSVPHFRMLLRKGGRAIFL